MKTSNKFALNGVYDVSGLEKLHEDISQFELIYELMFCIVGDSLEHCMEQLCDSMITRYGTFSKGNIKFQIFKPLTDGVLYINTNNNSFERG